MKKIFLISSITAVVSSLFLLSSCTPDDSVSKPVLGITEIGTITEATINCTNLIESNGSYTIKACGVCWNTSPNPTIENDKTSDTYGTGSYSSILTDLSPNTTYYLRAYATNKMGTAYGLQVTVTTKSFALTTDTPTFVMAQSAISGGSILTNGDSLTVTERGICWSTDANPTVNTAIRSINGSGAGTFVYKMTDLIPNTKYYARIYAKNSKGITYGNEIDFTTQNGIVNLSTFTATNLTASSVTVGGNVIDDGGALVTERGVCWSNSPNPTISLPTKTVDASGLGSFTSNLTGLQVSTTYYVRAYATNSVGTTYGNEISFTTKDLTGTVTDIDGNIYHYITIGTQTWMVENLKTTKYRDGTTIPNVTDGNQWAGLSDGAYCDYTNLVSNTNTYGCLYNWYAVNNSRNIAPVGWHVATNDEWGTLINYLGGRFVAGKSLKEPGTAHWIYNDYDANSKVGFLALPGGARTNSGSFSGMRYNGYWWTATESYADEAVYKNMYNTGKEVLPGAANKRYGLSVRCIRD